MFLRRRSTAPEQKDGAAAAVSLVKSRNNSGCKIMKNASALPAFCFSLIDKRIEFLKTLAQNLSITYLSRRTTYTAGLLDELLEAARH